MTSRDKEEASVGSGTGVATETLAKGDERPAGRDAMAESEFESELMEEPVGPAPEPGPAVEYEDVDDIIGIAAEMKNAEEDQLSVEDVKEIGRDLGLAERHIEAAVQEQERREEAAAEQAKEEARKAAARKKQLLKIGLIAAGVVAVFFVIGLIGKSGMTDTLATVEQKRAQVRSVMERKAEVEARYEGMAELSREAEAELAGALNRVSIEKRRYDEAATAYNADANGFPSSLWVSLFGLPDEVPLSNEIEEW